MKKDMESKLNECFSAFAHLDEMDPRCMEEFSELNEKIVKVCELVGTLMELVTTLRQRIELLEQVQNKSFDSDNSSFGPSVPPIKG